MRRYFCWVLIVILWVTWGFGGAVAQSANVNEAERNLRPYSRERALSAQVEAKADAHRDDVIRLRVIAATDDAEDQRIKYAVRDAVVATVSEWIAESDSVEAAYAAIHAHMPDIWRCARSTASAEGFTDSVTVRLGMAPFPIRRYDRWLVPSGIYRTVTVTLGAGEGKNWWCILFPKLCLGPTACASEPVVFYSSLVRWLTRWI